MNTPEKVAYIKGLMDGMKLDETNDQVRILKEVVSVLESLAAENAELKAENEKLNE